MKDAFQRTDKLLFVISAPAGTGKSTLVKKLVENFPKELQQTCSMTTRPLRQDEIDGKAYHFVSIESFEEAIEKDLFLEYTHIFGHFYGTLKSNIKKILKTKHAILVIDTQGALEVKKKMENAVLIFIAPPTMEALQERLRHRATEGQQELLLRLERAKKEISMAKYYQYVVVNRDLMQAYDELKEIIIQEETKRRDHGIPTNE